MDPYTKLIFTWESAFSVEGSVVTLTLCEIAKNSTELHLTQVKFSDQERRDDQQGGWTAISMKLNEVLG